MIRQRFQALEWVLDERLRRLVAAAEAEAIGYGGPSRVSRATGVSRRAIRIGAEELKAVNVKRDDFHGEWNYTIYPSS